MYSVKAKNTFSFHAFSSSKPRYWNIYLYVYFQSKIVRGSTDYLKKAVSPYASSESSDEDENEYDDDDNVILDSSGLASHQPRGRSPINVRRHSEGEFGVSLGNGTV